MVVRLIWIPPYDGPEFAAVHTWIWRLVALSVSPLQFLRVVWNNCLTNPPRTGDARVDANLIAFRDYYIHQWLPDRDKAELWNHFDRDGPRITNHAEGYHRGLSSVFDTRKRTRLGIFLGKMQELHHEIRQRVRQLEQGAPAGKRSPACSRPKWLESPNGEGYPSTVAGNQSDSNRGQSARPSFTTPRPRSTLPWMMFTYMYIYIYLRISVTYFCDIPVTYFCISNSVNISVNFSLHSFSFNIPYCLG